MIFVVIAAAASVCSAASFGCDSGTTYMKDALAPYVEKGELPGAVCILYNNGVVETTCIGYADVAAKRPITVNDVFAQCSQTKGFCGVTVAMLVKTGAIDYETKSPVDAGTYRQELSLERGELKDLVVTPAARRADVVFANQRW